ncbi:MAG: GPW/gp25 family protein [Gammaproteobacteria bacterium]|nr:GPW/gp25 family protein [Gammaproteobacteria bacterium]
MNAQTGQAISDLDHIQQSLSDIFRTHIGSRAMRREYGSLVPEYIDHPITPATRLKLISAMVMAALRWEPRIRISRIALSVGETASALIAELHATRTEGPLAGEVVSMAVPLRGPTND